MNRENFKVEIKKCPLEELEVIYDSQKDLYSEEEMNIILERIDELKGEIARNIEERLPKEIVCPKCDGVNAFENDTCQFCGQKFDKSKYYDLEYGDDYIESEKNDRSYTFQYVVSFLIPLIGFILGAILLSNDSEEKRTVGKTCVILGGVSVAVCYLLWIIVLN